jgi:hypothetical protein
MVKAESQPPTDEPQDEQEGVTSQPVTGTRLTAREIYHNVRIAAEEEMKRPPSALFWSALTCGLVIGFSFLAGGYLTTLAPSSWGTAAKALGYPLGFIFVVLARNHGKPVSAQGFPPPRCDNHPSPCRVPGTL